MEEIYPVLFIDAIHYSVRDNGVVRKLAAYVILGISCTGHKEVLISLNQNLFNNASSVYIHYFIFDSLFIEHS